MQDQASKAPKRVVFDCNVYLQAAVRDGGPAFACITLAESGGCIALVSTDTLAELTEILSRPSLRKKFTALTDPHVDAYLSRVKTTAEIVDDVPPVFSYPRDPKDEPYLNLAIAGHADVIVSRDNDLLSLATASDDVSREFRKTSPMLKVLDPVDFLRLLRAEQPAE